MIDEVKALRVEVASLTRERDDAEAALTTSNVLNGQRCQRISELENETERVGAALRAYIEGHELALTRAEAAESALAAARRECDGLRRHLRRMIDWADLHVNEVEAIAAASKDPVDARRARAARAEYDFASKALAAPAAASGEDSK